MWGMDITARPRPTGRCAACAGELEHCHEVAVEHVDGRVTCAEEHCTVDVRVHRFVVVCAEVGCADCGHPAEDEHDLLLAA